MGWILPAKLNGPLTPELWLNIATHGLASQAEERVRAEYLAYLEDALEAGESRAAVLAEWGDPHRANAELKKAHLTTREARYLPPGYASSWVGFGRALGEDAVILGVWIYKAMQDFLRGEATAFITILFGLTLLAIVARWFVLSRHAFTPQVRALLHWLLRPISIGLVIMFAFLVWKGQGLAEMRELLGEGPLGFIVVGFMVYHFSRLLTGLSAARKSETQAA